MSKNSFARILCALLSGIMLFTTIACAEKTDDDPGETKSQQETSADTEETDPRLAVSDGIPDGLTYGGKDFVTVVQEDHMIDIYVEIATGDIVEDRVFNRNSEISERFDIKIVEPVNALYTDLTTKIRNMVNSQDDGYDLVLQHAVESGLNAFNGYFGNWHDVQYMDFTQPWYPQITVENLTLNGKMFVAISDIAVTAIGNTYCMFFDKVYAENQNIHGIYDLVENGQWTIDKQIEITKGIYEDKNGNGRSDKEDFFGFLTSDRSPTVTYLWAFDDPIFVITDDNDVELTFNNEKSVDIVDKLREYYWNTEGSHVEHDHGAQIDLFANGHGIFANGIFRDSELSFRDYDNDFGIIPYPKWDEKQESYLTMVDGNFSVIAYLSVEQEPEFVGAITHALGCYSYKYLVPEYYDVALKVKNTRDEESIAILDMLMQNRSMDFPYIYDCWKGFVFKFEALLYENSKTKFSSFYKSNERAALKHYQSIIELFGSAE